MGLLYRGSYAGVVIWGCYIGIVMREWLFGVVNRGSYAGVVIWGCYIGIVMRE